MWVDLGHPGEDLLAREVLGHLCRVLGLLWQVTTNSVAFAVWGQKSRIQGPQDLPRPCVPQEPCLLTPTPDSDPEGGGLALRLLYSHRTCPPVPWDGVPGGEGSQ